MKKILVLSLLLMACYPQPEEVAPVVKRSVIVYYSPMYCGGYYGMYNAWYGWGMYVDACGGLYQPYWYPFRPYYPYTGYHPAPPPRHHEQPMRPKVGPHQDEVQRPPQRPQPRQPAEPRRQVQPQNRTQPTPPSRQPSSTQTRRRVN